MWLGKFEAGLQRLDGCKGLVEHNWRRYWEPHNHTSGWLVVLAEVDNTGIGTLVSAEQ